MPAPVHRKETEMRVPVLSLLFTVGIFAACAPAASRAAVAAQDRPAAAEWQLPALPPAQPIAAGEYASRRRALMAQLTDGVLLVTGSPEPAADYMPYEQAPDFRYLTGIMEPSAALLMEKRGATVTERLFVLPRDPAREIWEGARLGADGAREISGIAGAQPIQRFPAVLDSLLAVHGTLFATVQPPVDIALDAELTHAQQILARLRDRHPTLQIRLVNSEIRQLRATKSAAELDRIRRAVYISSLAHREAMRATEPGMNEFEIKGLMEYIFTRYGTEGPAYSSIVGSGPNSTTLHYRDADRFMGAGEVLLIDAAASYAGYAADVTRTFPVNGRYTPEQRAIYEIVLRAQKAAESLVRPGATWQELSAAANTEISEGLARLGLIDEPGATYDCGTSRTGEPLICPQYRIFYMHGLGHGVGLAVHDPDISQLPGGFRPGSAVTIEPGIYVRADAFDFLPDTPANRAMIQRLRPALDRYRNIGVRIEDVYVFDERGLERVSAGVPREIDEIEALMRETSPLSERRRMDIVEWYRTSRGR
jgi:Xaa-Pro aminopeptidase